MPNTVTYTEPELIRLLQDKNIEAFGYLYDSYSPAIYGVILRIVINEEIAQDVLQDCFLKYWNNFNTYDDSKGKLYTWLLNVARNLAIDMIRSKGYRNNSKIQSMDDSVNRFERFVQNNNSTIDYIGLKEIVSKLKPEHRLIIDLAYFEGYTQEEIAKELNIPLGTVKTRARSALSQLRAIFNTK